MRRVIISALAVLGLLAVSSVAQATVIDVASTTVFDNSGFEGDTVGSAPSVVTPGTASWNVAGGVTVVNGAVPGPNEGSNYLKMNSPATSSRASAGFAAASAGQLIHAEWAIYIPEAPLAERQKAGTPYQASLSGDPTKTWYSGSDAAKTMWGVCYKEGISATYISTTGIAANEVALFYAGNGTPGGYANVTVGGQNLYIKKDQWHSVVQDYVENATTYTLTIDGVTTDSLVASYGTAGWGYGATDNLIHWSSTEGTWPSPGGSYVSYVDAVPEPSTVVLLITGLIGLVVYAWRKRR